MRPVLIVTASMGAGHTQVATELASRLSGLGARAEVVDVLELAGGPGNRVRGTYRLLLRWAPWVYDGAMRFWARCPTVSERFIAARARNAEHALGELVAARDPVVVVSNYNLAAQALGRLVERGEITAPVVTLVTDPGAHPYWVSGFVTLHIAPIPETAARLSALGASRVVVAPPVVRRDIAASPDRATARHTLGIGGERVALVSAGSWGAGRIQRTVGALSGAADVSLIVLCGNNDCLRAELDGRPGVHTVGWTSDVPIYLAAADILVDNAGGLTCWESLACGTPVVLFHPLPGHGRLNARTLADAGLARLARTRAELLEAVRSPGPPPLLSGADETERYVLSLADVSTRVGA